MLGGWQQSVGELACMLGQPAAGAATPAPAAAGLPAACAALLARSAHRASLLIICLARAFSCPAPAGADDRDLAAWLRETVGEAVRTADQHDSMKRVIREMRMGIESRFRLSAIQVCGGKWRRGQGNAMQVATGSMF